MRTLLRLLLGLCFAATAWPVSAQTTSGSISGTVVDPQGAVVPKAQVTARNAGQTTSTSTSTDRAGNFVFPQLPPANYTLIVEVAGFKKLEQSNVVLNANTSISVGRLRIEIGDMAQERVEVTAQGQQLQTDSFERGGSLVGTQLKNIQVNGRTYLGLLQLLPGTITDRNYDLNTNEIGNIYSNGSRGNQQNLTLDGVSNTDYGANGRMIVTVSMDAVQEFRVLSSNYDAQYGKSSGAQISVVTKGGTQEFHGSGYWFYRDRAMNANSWINNRDGNPKPRYHFNYGGYTLGGPVFVPGKFNTGKDELFFFWSDEYQRQLTPRDQNGNSLFRTTVPTALERQGDFSQSVDSSGKAFNLIRDPLSGLPCSASDTRGCFQEGGVLGRIPASRLYSPGVALLNLFPLPNTAGRTGYNYLYEPSGSVPRHEQMLRLDYQPSAKWRVSGSWVHLAQDVVSINGSAAGYSLSPNFPITPVNFDHPGNLFSVTTTTILNSRTTNELRLGFSSHPVTILPDDPQALTAAGTGVNLPTLFSPSAGWIPDFTFGGSRIANSPALRYSGAGGAYTPFDSKNSIYELSDNLTYARDKHLFKAGVFVHRNVKDQNAFAPTEGIYNWGDSSSNPLDTGFGFANAAIGVYQQFTQATQSRMGRYRFTNVEGYVQDTWKPTSRLTFIYGVRAVWAQPWYDAQQQTSNFFSDRWSADQAPELYWPGLQNGQRVPLVGSPKGPVATDPSGAPLSRTMIGRLVPGSGDLTNGIVVAGDGIEKYMIKDQGILLGPRLGVVYDLTGKGNLILRAGAGRYFDRYQGNLIFGTILNPPSIYTPVLYNGFAQNISPDTATLAPSGLSMLSYDGKIPTTYSYSLGIQARLPWATALDVSYVGSQVRHLVGTRNINGIPYGTAFLPENQDPTKVAASPNAPLGSNAYDAIFLRPYRGYGSITRNEFGNNSNYNALQVTLNRRFAEGLFFGASYTWSKCLDFGSNDGSSLRIDGRTKEANYGPCDYDVRHNLAVNYVYAFPSVASVRLLNHRALRAVLDNWQISGTTRVRTGMPFSVGYNVPGYSGVNFTGTPDYGARVNVVGDPYAGTSSDPYNRLNPAAFAPPAPGSIGMESRRNYLNTPGVQNWDMSLQKAVPLKGHVRLELRVDAFNVFNHPQFSGINSTISFASLSDPTVTNPGRKADGSENRGGFGTINGVRPPRILQTVVRLTF